MSEQSNGGPDFVLWTTDDYPGYSKLSGAQQHEVQNALAKVRAEADDASGISRPPEGIQRAGDGESVCWRNLTPVPYLKEYVPALSDALDRANKRRGDRPKLRLRLAVTYGTTVAASGGSAGTPPIEAERLVSSRPCKQVTQRLADSGLVVIISDRVFQDTVKETWQELDPKAYVPVKVQDKHGKSWAAHITVPGASVDRVRAALRHSIVKPAASLAAVAALALVGALAPGSALSGASSSSHPASSTPSGSVSPSGTPTPHPSDSDSPSPDVTPHRSNGTRSISPAPVTTSPKPHATATTATYRPGMIENVGDKLVIDMYNGVTTDGTGVTVVPAGSDKGQIWTVDKPDGSGYQYSASSLIFHNALDSSQTEVLAADPNTLAVQISSFSYGTYRAEQLWTRSSVTNSSPHAWYVQTTSSGQTLCLTAHGKQGQLTVAACVSGDKAQQWIFH